MKNSGEFDSSFYAIDSEVDDTNAAPLENNEKTVNKDKLLTINLPEKDDLSRDLECTSSAPKFSFKELMNKLASISACCFLNYVLTYGLVPGVAIEQPLFNMNRSYRVNTIMLLFNLFDTIGKWSPKVFPMSVNKVWIVTIFRTLFVFSFPIVVYMGRHPDIYNISIVSIFTVINMVLLAFTQGYTSSVLFTAAPRAVPKHLVGKSGSTLGFVFGLGAFGGSLFGLLVMKNFI